MPHHWLLQTFFPFFLNNFWDPLEGVCDIDVTFIAEISVVSYSLKFNQLYVSILINICCKKKIQGWDLKDSLISSYNNKS